MISIVTAFLFVVEDVLQHILRERQRDLLPGQRRVRDQPNQRSLELADVRLDLAGDVDRDVVGQRHRFGFRLLLENRDFGLEIRRLNVGNQSPLEPRPQPLLERRNLVGRAVAAEHDLLLRIVERVERVEELGLRAFFAGEKLDVVDQQHVHRPIALAEIEHAIVADRVDHLVHESLGRDVGELQIAIVLQHVVPDRVHQVRLAETHAAVDEQRVVRTRRRFGHRAARRVRKLIRRSDDERVEGVAGIEAGRARAWSWRRRRRVERRGFFSAELNRHDVGLRVGNEIHREIRTPDLVQRFADDARVVLRQPVLEEAVRHADRHRRPVVGDEGRRPEPGVEAVPVHLRLDAREDFVPEVHFIQ